MQNYFHFLMFQTTSPVHYLAHVQNIMISLTLTICIAFDKPSYALLTSSDTRAVRRESLKSEGFVCVSLEVMPVRNSAQD